MERTDQDEIERKIKAEMGCDDMQEPTEVSGQAALEKLREAERKDRASSLK